MQSSKIRTRWLGLVLASVTVAAFGRPAAPTGLLVNGVSNPLAIDRETTRFTWRAEVSRRGETQTAYQILVSSNPQHLEAGTSEWWDSGKVDSDRSAAIEYAGQALPPAKRFWWKVRIWDQTGKASPYSAPGHFDTGLTQTEWTARYIWDGTTNLNNFAYFRKTFSIARRPALAKVYVTAHNDYLLYCNGQLLGQGPARCDPYYFGQYNAYDVTGLLKTGSNVFAAIGHWQGTFINGGVNAQPAFLLEARLDYPDGSSSRVGTDESWKVLAHTAFIETNASYFSAGGNKKRASIQTDARGEPAERQAADLDDPQRASVTVVVRSGYRTTFVDYGGAGGNSELKPLSVTSTNGTWLVDFGRCVDGWPKLTMQANRSGDVVRVECFQMTGERKPAGWDQYICRGGTETWKPDFPRHTSFQVIRISGYAGELKASDVRGIWAYCDADVAGRFRCSSDLLNSIYELCERSARQNVQQAIISVDANREQSEWTADCWNIGNVLLYNHRNTMMIDQVVRNYAVEQLPNGNFPACCPAYRARCIPEWSMYWPMLLWQQYLFSGDATLLREMAPRLVHFLEWMKRYQDPATKLVNPLGWRISEYAGGNLPSGGYNVATACQYYENLRIASRVFSVLGQTNRSGDYSRQAEEVKAGINSNLFNGEFYFARTDRKEMFPLASAWALRFDLVPAAAKPAVLEAIRKSGKPNIGGYGGDALYSGLWAAGGMGDFIVGDLARYRPMLAENRANWETFSTGHEVNHAWTAYPGYLFQKYISGIQPTGGGFSTFDVRPEITGLRFAESTVPTVKGSISTRWEKIDSDRLKLFLAVPSNTRATLYMPKVAGRVTLKESGAVLWPANSRKSVPGVLATEDAGSSIKVVLGAGAYHFLETPLIR